MSLFTVVKRSPFVVALACLVALSMVLISESSYQRSLEMLNDLGQTAGGVAQDRQAVYRTLMLSRIGVAVLCGISLLALMLYLRKRFALELKERQRKNLIETERDQLGSEVTDQTAQLVKLTHHLQTAREDERNRLARDLHDELGALLTSAKLDAARIKSRLGSSAPEASERLQNLVGTLNSGIELKRRIIEDLRPSALGHLGLAVALDILGREFSERSGVKFHGNFESVKLTESAQLAVYRLVQEAITNITKHAKTQQVWVSLGEQDGFVAVSIRDDGVGFDTAVAPASAYGLLGMRYRIKAERGSMRLVSFPGQGTLIEVRLPRA
jgi:signal transduction histidine kinase